MKLLETGLGLVLLGSALVLAPTPSSATALAGDPPQVRPPLERADSRAHRQVPTETRAYPLSGNPARVKVRVKRVGSPKDPNGTVKLLHRGNVVDVGRMRGRTAVLTVPRRFDGPRTYTFVARFFGNANYQKSDDTVRVRVTR